jgi:hypothetical protein
MNCDPLIRAIALHSALRKAALAPHGLTVKKAAAQFRTAANTHWEFLSNNFEVLALTNEPTPSGLTPKKVRTKILKLYTKHFNPEQKAVFQSIQPTRQESKREM